MNTTLPQARTIKAFNTASASENRIHDDATAQRFGFTGALVPGVEVYAYMCHLPVAAWGRAFLENGELDCRFLKPVYDGANTTTSALSGNADEMTLAVRCESADSATGTAWRSPHMDRWNIADFETAPPPSERRSAGFDTLPVGKALGIEPVVIDEAARDAYLADIGETESLYQDEALVHPGQILRLCNAALVQNVILGPWIHVGSRVRNFDAACVGDRLSLRARVTSNQETKGHAIVSFDAVALANNTTLIAQITHTAIWRPRQVAVAA